MTERSSGPDEQRLGGMNASAQALGNVRHGQPVEVAQRERGAVVRADDRQDVS